ncbi:MAG: VOC family protein [Flavobacteriales bacterium]|nr:VOC family protein [Flavobacteriales bacterium]
MSVVISGIQQLGVGIPDVHGAFEWYRKHFGMDIKVFEEAAEAALMLPYTQNEVRSRHAILALNIQSGAGFEIWQYTSRKPVAPDFQIQLGDYGLNVGKIRTYDVKKVFKKFKAGGVNILGELCNQPDGNPTFYLADPYGNVFQMVQDAYKFKDVGNDTAGPMGCTIGVSDIEKSRKLYTEILGYDKVIYDETGVFDDFAGVNAGGEKYRRVLLTHAQPRNGAFSRMIGPSQIELVQGLNRTGRKIFEGRDWGDLGYIHLCFDINGMDELKALCASKGFPFTVDSANSFDMGEAAGRFSYIEDPDGTLIEFVETHKLPILKKIGWYKNLKNRDPKKPLPDWMLKAMSLTRIKD